MRKIIKITTFCLLLGTFFSCADWMDLAPEDGVVREKYWQTKEDVDAAVMGCYAAWMNDEVLARMFVWGELRADMTESSSNYVVSTLAAINQGEITTSNPYAYWGNYYTIINQCNTVLELAPQVVGRDRSFTETMLKQYKAEVLCIRALTYFYLLRTFRDVPYITQASLYDSQDFTAPKTSQADILDSLAVSLKSAEADIPASYDGGNAFNKGRFTVWGLKALLADIYLWQGNYEGAIRECTDIMNSGQFSLVPVSRTLIQEEGLTGETISYYVASESDAAAFFNAMYVNGNSVESIFELQFGTDKQNVFVDLFSPDRSAPLIPSATTFSEVHFESSSISREWADIRGDGVAYKMGYIWKWIGLSRDEYILRDINSSFSNWIFYRYADVLLMKAEALVQQAKENGGTTVSNLQEALDLVYEIRTRGNAPESTDEFYNMDRDNPDLYSLETFILSERAREFAFEGKRWFDVLRHARRDNYSERNLNYLLQMSVYATTSDKVTSLQTKWRNNPGSHYFPIYYYELELNKKLEQNEFYK